VNANQAKLINNNTISSPAKNAKFHMKLYTNNSIIVLGPSTVDMDSIEQLIKDSCGEDSETNIVVDYVGTCSNVVCCKFTGVSESLIKSISSPLLDEVIITTFFDNDQLSAAQYKLLSKCSNCWANGHYKNECKFIQNNFIGTSIIAPIGNKIPVDQILDKIKIIRGGKIFKPP